MIRLWSSRHKRDFKKVLDSMVAFCGDEYLWWQVAELGFDALMVRSRARLSGFAPSEPMQTPPGTGRVEYFFVSDRLDFVLQRSIVTASGGQ